MAFVPHCNIDPDHSARGDEIVAKIEGVDTLKCKVL